MSKQLHESLSALMDNEADALEMRRLLKEMEAMDVVKASVVDDGSENSLSNSEMNSAMSELKGKWHRYHVLSASCKQEIHSAPSCNLLEKIQLELENESLPTIEPVRHSFNNPGKGISQFLGQGVIAASVALAVLFTADIVMLADNESVPNASSELAGNDAASGSLPGLTGELNPFTETRAAVQAVLDVEEMSRLERVVSEELEDSLDNQKIPATFVPKKTP